MINSSHLWTRLTQSEHTWRQRKHKMQGEWNHYKTMQIKALRQSTTFLYFFNTGHQSKLLTGRMNQHLSATKQEWKTPNTDKEH